MELECAFNYSIKNKCTNGNHTKECITCINLNCNKCYFTCRRCKSIQCWVCKKVCVICSVNCCIGCFFENEPYCNYCNSQNIN